MAIEATIDGNISARSNATNYDIWDILDIINDEPVDSQVTEYDDEGNQK